jgi:hypothetical protein
MIIKMPSTRIRAETAGRARVVASGITKTSNPMAIPEAARVANGSAGEPVLLIVPIDLPRGEKFAG